MAVRQVINTAIERCLEGRRTWSASCPHLETFLKGVIDNLVWTEKKKAIRSKADPIPDAGVDIASHEPSGEDSVIAEQGRAAICAAFEACVSDDANLQDLYLAILDGNVKREDIAEALNWTPEEVSAARIKLKRRLLSRFPQTFVIAAKERAS